MIPQDLSVLQNATDTQISCTNLLSELVIFFLQPSWLIFHQQNHKKFQESLAKTWQPWRRTQTTELTIDPPASTPPHLSPLHPLPPHPSHPSSSPPRLPPPSWRPPPPPRCQDCLPIVFGGHHRAVHVPHRSPPSVLVHGTPPLRRSRPCRFASVLPIFLYARPPSLLISVLFVWASV